jgi:uncharacterized membrane protein HdeD (DUF308 family)
VVGVRTIASHWWLPLIRGLVAIAFGVLAFAFPVATAGAFVILFGAFALVDGLVTVTTALRFSHPHAGGWWWMLAQGFIGILIGVVTFAWPAITALALGILVAAWAISTGILELGAAFRLRTSLPGEILLVVSGLLSIVLGVALAFFPLTALLAWVWLVAAYAIVAGVVLLGLSFRLRAVRGRLTPE